MTVGVHVLTSYQSPIDIPRWFESGRFWCVCSIINVNHLWILQVYPGTVAPSNFPICLHLWRVSAAVSVHRVAHVCSIARMRRHCKCKVSFGGVGVAENVSCITCLQVFVLFVSWEVWCRISVPSSIRLTSVVSLPNGWDHCVRTALTSIQQFLESGGVFTI